MTANPQAAKFTSAAPIIMKGYWNRPDATAEVLKDGWLYTGDLGFFDADGNLFITGRKKDVIILSQRKECLSRGDRSALSSVTLH